MSEKRHETAPDPDDFRRLDELVGLLVGDAPTAGPMPTARVRLPAPEELEVRLVKADLVLRLDELRRNALGFQAAGSVVAAVPLGITVNILTSDRPISATATVTWVVLAITALIGLFLFWCAAAALRRAAVKRRELMGHLHAD